MKKALLVGVNYTSTPAISLRGCIDDIVNIHGVLVDSFDYSESNIIKLRDDTKKASLLPTRANILKNLSDLVSQSANLSEIWFHYSGHGSQVKAIDKSEIDNLDEVIVPVDYQKNGFITDNEIYNIIKNSKCKTILIFDSCHSGSMCDLQWSFLYKNGSILKSLNTNKIISNPNIFCFSGCKDAQTSADAYNNESQESVGAFTDAFIYSLRANHMSVDILKLYTDTCTYIKSGGFTQTPLFSCSYVSPSYVFSRTNSTEISMNQAPVILSSINVELISDDPLPIKNTVKVKEITVVVDVPASRRACSSPNNLC